MNEAVKIEKGIPIPPRMQAGNGRSKYPFSEMKIGDSILISIKSRQCAYYWQMKHPEFKFIARKVDDKHMRVWRVKE